MTGHTLHPMHNAVLVEMRPEEERYAGVVIIPGTSLHSGQWDEEGGTAGRYSDIGTVVETGAGYKYGKKFIPDFSGSKQGKFEILVHDPPLPLTVKEGDVVVLAHKGGEDWIENGRRYRIISEAHIEAVLEEGSGF